MLAKLNGIISIFLPKTLMSLSLRNSLIIMVITCFRFLFRSSFPFRSPLYWGLSKLLVFGLFNEKNLMVEGLSARRTISRRTIETNSFITGKFYDPEWSNLINFDFLFLIKKTPKYNKRLSQNPEHPEKIALTLLSNFTFDPHHETLFGRQRSLWIT